MQITRRSSKGAVGYMVNKQTSTKCVLVRDPVIPHGRCIIYSRTR